jgi:D-Tyr-tRNAtyr deacylase
MVVSEAAQVNRANLASAKAAVVSAVEQAAVAPLARIAMAGITGKFALLLAQPTPDGMVNIVGVLPEAQDALVDALIAKMAKRKVADDAAEASLSKEVTDIMAGSAAVNAPVYAKQA